MIKVSVLYKATPEAPFNMEYYLSKHTPMALELLGDTCKGITIDRGLSGPMPGTEATYTVIANLLFERLEDYQMAFMQHGMALMADFPNYTSITPTIQINEVLR